MFDDIAGERALLCGAGEIGAQFRVTVGELLELGNTRVADFAAWAAASGERPV
jgi:hypothetical protein